MVQQKTTEKKKKPKVCPKIVLTCDCLAGHKFKTCDHLEIYDFGNGDIEINGVFLGNKKVEKLRKFLFWRGDGKYQ